MTDRDTLVDMAQAISVRLDDDSERALRALEATGLSRSDAIRTALVESARRLRLPVGTGGRGRRARGRRGRPRRDALGRRADGVVACSGVTSTGSSCRRAWVTSSTAPGSASWSRPTSCSPARSCWWRPRHAAPVPPRSGQRSRSRVRPRGCSSSRSGRSTSLDWGSGRSPQSRGALGRRRRAAHRARPPLSAGTSRSQLPAGWPAGWHAGLSVGAPAHGLGLGLGQARAGAWC